MNKFRIGVIVGAVIIIIAELTITDYDNFFGSKNVGNYLVILSMILVIISLILGIKNERKKLKE